MSALPSTSDSQRLEIVSVGDFFRQINWSGATLPIMDDTTVETPPYETVGQFFATFPWQGTAAALPSDDLNAVSDDDVDLVERESLTLEDLSALF